MNESLMEMVEVSSPRRWVAAAEDLRVMGEMLAGAKSLRDSTRWDDL